MTVTMARGIGGTRSSLLAMLVVLVGLLVGGCGRGPKARGQLDALRQVAAKAEANGAKVCAPRELAVAQSHLDFAETELDQGFVSKALDHLLIAEPNAEAALALSPPEYCLPKPGDRDGDGYVDPEDSCPDEPERFNGFADSDGCPDDPDTDADGLSDSEDACVLEAEDADGYLDDDGCPELDNDLDGLLDADDQCPTDPEDPDGYQDQDGCPDLDNDLDGVADLEDQCPNEIGAKDMAPLGCPQKPALVMVSDCEVKVTQQIHFAYNKARIRANSQPVLDAVVEVLQKHPSIELEVQGHTDDQGSAQYNQGLSERRASTVVQYLVARGVDPARLASKGYGLEQPLVPNDSPQNRALNRRVQFLRTEGQAAGCSAQ